MGGRNRAEWTPERRHEERLIRRRVHLRRVQLRRREPVVVHDVRVLERARDIAAQISIFIFDAAAFLPSHENATRLLRPNGPNSSDSGSTPSAFASSSRTAVASGGVRTRIQTRTERLRACGPNAH